MKEKIKFNGNQEKGDNVDKFKRLSQKKENKFINMLKNSWKYYKKNMLRKHFVLYIISLILFVTVFVYSLSTYDAKYFLENVGNVARINKIMSEFIFFTVMSIMLGFLPFIRASVVSIVYAARLSSYICNLLFMRTYDKTLVSIIAVIMLLILTFSITIGINLCGVITKIIKDKVSKNKSKSKV